MLQTLFNDENQKGLLVYSPFLLATASLFIGFKIGLLAFFLFFLQASLIFSIRNLIPSQQRFPIILIVGVSLVLITKMLLNATIYLEAQEVALFLPLLVMNSLVLSFSEITLSRQSLKTLFINFFSIGIAIILLFAGIGFLRMLLINVSIFSSPAGSFLLLGFLFSIIKFFETINKERGHIE